MMACNTESTGKPDLQTIFDLISSNDFDALHTLLNPLTLHDRRCIVNQKLHGKSTLYRAVECGSKPIVKYLLDECMANIIEESLDGRIFDWPLRKVVEKLDIFMLFVIKRYCGYPLRNYKIQETVDYTLEMEYYSVIWFLELRNCEILRSNRGKNMLDMLRLTNLKGRKSYTMRSEMFLEVTASGNLIKVKLLVASGLDIHLQNDEGITGLCLAILNGNEEIVDFLIKNKVYSLLSFACSLELSGAKLIIFHDRKDEGVNLWKRSIQIRNNLQYGFSDKNKITGLGSEFKTEKEINVFESPEDGTIYLQALMVFSRLLHRCSSVTMKAFEFANRYIAIMEPLTYLAILCELFDLVPFKHKKRSTLEKEAKGGLFDLCKIHFLSNFSDITGYTPQLEKLLQLLDPQFWKSLIPRMPDFYVFCYTVLMKTLLYYLPLIQSRRPFPNDEDLIRFHLTKIIQAELDPYPTTLLHVAIDEYLPSSVILFLLECKADPNGKDFLGNTPLHLVSTAAQRHSYLLQLTDILVRAGGHIDTINNDGVEPRVLLAQKGLIEYPLKHISLQCFAAQAINAHRIFVDVEKVPKSIFEYIKIHSFREIQPFNFFFYYAYKFGF